MHRFGPLVALLITSFLSVPIATADTIVHVSPTGDDAADGSRARPLRTPAKARDLVRSIKAKAAGPITVGLMGGTYYLDAPIVFTPAESDIAKAGLRKGDVVLKVGDAIVSDVADLQALAAKTRTLTLEIFRDQNRQARTLSPR